MAEAPTPAGPPKNGLQILLERIRSWPLSRKLALAAATALSVSIFAFIIIQAQTADYQLLYANLTENDAASVVEWLKGQQIPYRLQANGTRISIPADKVYETRLSLAATGLPRGGGVGFEIFDKQSFALTDFVQKVNYTRALQGELGRTITSLGPVESARVHLALPEKRLFKNQQQEATASVILKLAPGRSLSESQVQGIVHLVSSSVEGMAPDHVTVIDQNGNVLTRPASEGLPGRMTPDMLEMQLEVEKNLEERAQSLLDTALGPGKSLVRVTAQMDFSRSEQTEERYDPEEPVIRSEQTTEEKTGSEVVGGIPGVQSNIQGSPGTQRTAASTPPSSKSQRTTNYEISKVTSKTINPVGTIRKLSVAVLVADKEKPGTTKAESVPRTPDELASLKNMISSALGIDSSRGDQIDVTSMPFTEKKEMQAAETAASAMLYQYLPVIRYALLLVAGLLLYFLLIRPIIKTLRRDVTEHYKTVEELEAMQARAEQETKERERMNYPEDTLSKIRREVSEDPFITAHVIKKWIQEKE